MNSTSPPLTADSYSLTGAESGRPEVFFKNYKMIFWKLQNISMAQMAQYQNLFQNNYFEGKNQDLLYPKDVKKERLDPDSTENFEKAGKFKES